MHHSPAARKCLFSLDGLATYEQRRMVWPKRGSRPVDPPEIGRASCRERVEIAGVAFSVERETVVHSMDNRRTLVGVDLGLSVRQVQRDHSTMLVSAHLQPSYT